MSLRSLLRPWKRRVLIALYQVLLAIPGGPSVYYVLNRRYAREHRATLMARLRHLQASVTTSPHGLARNLEYRFRRNVHRLEKGLIMRPRRPVFALDYIADTVGLYSVVIGAPEGQLKADPNLVRWANDVLDEYFRIVAAHPVVDSARERYGQARRESACGGVPFRPRPLDLPDNLPSFQQVQALAWARRSVRWYQERPVPRALLDQAIEVAGLSPSACNRQPFRYRIFDTAESAARVGAVPLGTAGFSHNFPCVIVVIGDVGAYPDEKDRHLIYIDGGLATMSLQFALVSLGLGSCSINWPDVAEQEARIRQVVELGEAERVVMLLSVGFPASDGLVPYSAKKGLDRLRSFAGG